MKEPKLEGKEQRNIEESIIPNRMEKTEKFENISETPVAKPLAQFRPSSSSRPQRSGPLANHYVGFPGSGAPVSSNPVTTPTGRQVLKNPIGMQRQIELMPTLLLVVGKGKDGGKGQGGSQGGYGNSQFVNSAITSVHCCANI